MADTSRNTFMRPDTFLGICEAMGQDFGFNPLWLRLALVPPIFFQPLYTLVAYLGLGLVVLASRLAWPAPRGEVAASTADEMVSVPTAAIAPAAPRRVEEAQLQLAA